MRLLAATLICLAAAAPILAPSQALAEGWEVMFLADSGGSRPMQVDPADLGSVESVTMLAYVDNDRGERLSLNCQWTGGAASDYGWALRLFPGREPAFLPKEADGNQIALTFDGIAGTTRIGRVSFVQEAFLIEITEITAADIRQGRRIRLEMPGAYLRGGMPYRTDFSLSGSEAAIDKACPPL